jgi:TetR/AcrR family transcriptional regulator
MGINERRAREKKQRRNMIIEAAEKVFFAKGLDPATMDDIAKEAELSKGTLYLYFKNKEDLYLALTHRSLEQLVGMFLAAVEKHSSGLDKVRAIGRAYMEFAKRHPDKLQSMLYFASIPIEFDGDSASALACAALGEESIQILVRALQSGLEDGSIRKDIDPPKAAVVLWATSTGILQWIATKYDHVSKNHDFFRFSSDQEILDYYFHMTGSALASR